LTAEWVTAIATAGTFVVIAGSAIAALAPIRHLRSSNQIAALNECRETIQSPDLQAAEQFVLELAPRLSDPAVQSAMIEKVFEQEYAPIRMIANFFENMGVFVKNGIIDRRIACDLWTTVVVRSLDALAPIVINRRAAFDVEPLWENFEYLATVCKQWAEEHPHGDYPRGARRMPHPELWPLVRQAQRRNS